MLFGSGAFIILPVKQLFSNKINLSVMGRGDKKTKKGKIFKGSFGKSRPRNTKKTVKKKESKS